MAENTGAGDGFKSVQFAGGSGIPSEPNVEGVVPLVIKQILEANNQLFGMAFRMVSIVGIVRNVENSSNKATFVIEDHTGQIDAFIWLTDGDVSDMPTIVLNRYARVFGSIRNQGGQKALMIFKIEPLSSMNDLTTHLLEVLNSRYMAEDFVKNAGAAGGSSVSNVDNQTSSNSNTGFGDGGVNPFHLAGQQLMVYNAVKEFKSDVGINWEELRTKFTDNSTDELENIMEYLTVEGYIYTTIDSGHWMCNE